MSWTSVRYRFRQSFPVPARKAYLWCTAFEPDDSVYFSVPGRRTIERLADDTLLMTDRTEHPSGPREITRLVRLDPREMAWTNTHLSGPFLHSQFWYRIVPDGAKRSHLEFEGLHLQQFARAPSPKEVARLAEEYRKNDAKFWSERLAPAMARDLAPRGRGRRGPSSD